MKAIKTTAALVLLSLFICVNGYGSNGTDAFNKVAVQNEIRSQLNIRVEKNEKIDVIFTTDTSGKVNLVIARNNDKILQRAVESEFARLRLSGLSPGDCYGITLSLKLI